MRCFFSVRRILSVCLIGTVLNVGPICGEVSHRLVGFKEEGTQRSARGFDRFESSDEKSVHDFYLEMEVGPLVRATATVYSGQMRVTEEVRVLGTDWWCRVDVRHPNLSTSKVGELHLPLVSGEAVVITFSMSGGYEQTIESVLKTDQAASIGEDLKEFVLAEEVSKRIPANLVDTLLLAQEILSPFSPSESPKSLDDVTYAVGTSVLPVLRDALRGHDKAPSSASWSQSAQEKRFGDDYSPEELEFLQLING